MKEAVLAGPCVYHASPTSGQFPASHEQNNIAFLPWAPLGQAKEAHDAIKELANDLDATPLQVALAWLLKRSKVILPIPGTSSIKHLEKNIAAAGLELSQAAYDWLSAVSHSPASLRG